MRALGIAAAAALGAFAVVGGGAAAGVRYNHTASAPLGLWLVRPIERPVRRGDMVALCLPGDVAAAAFERGFIGRGPCPDGGHEPVMKRVGAVAGDVVSVSASGVSVNGERVAPAALRSDSAGRELPSQAEGARNVADGTAWLLGDHSPRAWDSRYYGPVPLDRVLGAARPLVVLD